MQIASIILLAVAALGLSVMVARSAIETGPGCPADPRWLGYCSEIPQ